MKSAVEIIKERYLFYDETIYGKDVELNGQQVIELMEIYAEQFKAEQVMVENEADEKYFYTHCQIFQGIHAGEYLDKEDFMKYAKQFKAEQKQTIVTDLPAPPWDDNVTHNLELVSTNEKA